MSIVSENNVQCRDLARDLKKELANRTDLEEKLQSSLNRVEAAQRKLESHRNTHPVQRADSIGSADATVDTTLSGTKPTRQRDSQEFILSVSCCAS